MLISRLNSSEPPKGIQGHPGPRFQGLERVTGLVWTNYTRFSFGRNGNASPPRVPLPESLVGPAGILPSVFCHIHFKKKSFPSLKSFPLRVLPFSYSSQSLLASSRRSCTDLLLLREPSILTNPFVRPGGKIC